MFPYRDTYKLDLTSFDDLPSPKVHKKLCPASEVLLKNAVYGAQPSGTFQIVLSQQAILVKSGCSYPDNCNNWYPVKSVVPGRFPMRRKCVEPGSVPGDDNPSPKFQVNDPG